MCIKECSMPPQARSPNDESLSLKTKLIMVGFGATVALLISIVALQFLSFGHKGTEFNSIQDLKRAMLAPRSVDVADSSNEPVEQNISLRGIVEPHPNNSIIYTLRPNLDLTFIRARVRTNSCGMRSPERPVQKPANVFRIALIGDSFAFGWGVEQNKIFAQVLEDSLNKRSTNSLRFEVLNFGVPGYSTFQEVALLEERGLDFQPDAVLVYFVQNDFGMPFFIRDLDNDGGLLSSLKFVQMGKKLLTPKTLNNRIREIGLHPNQAMSRLATITREHGLKTYIAFNPRKEWKKYLKRLPAVRKNSGIQVIPLRDGLLEYITQKNIPPEALTLSYDPHPSEIRHTILGNLLTPYFLDAAGL